MNIDQFPIIASNIDERDLARFTKQLAVVGPALEAKSIPNPAYKDAKSIINRAIENAFSRFIRERYTYGGKWQSLSTAEYDLTDNSPMLHTVNGLIKKVEKTKLDTPFIKDMLAFLNEAKPLADAFEDLKGMVAIRTPVQRIDPKDAMRQKYTAPTAAKSTQKLVIDTLTQSVDGIYEELVQSIFDDYKKYAARYEEILDAAHEGAYPSPAQAFMSNPSHKSQEAYQIADMVFTSPEMSSFRRVFKNRPVQKPDADALMEQKARLLASEIRDNFIFKNLVKIDSIIEAKGNLKEIRPLESTIRMGTLRGDFRLLFTDGSSFMISNTVVWGVSKYGRVFQRFPLTFHDVTMPDGSRMSQPSEEKMNTIFIGKD